MKPVAINPKSHPIKFKLSPELYGLIESLSGLKAKGATYHPADLELLELQLRAMPRTDFRLYFVRGTQEGRGEGKHRLVTVCIVKQKLGGGEFPDVVYYRGIAICHTKDSPNPVEGKCRAIRRVLRPLHSGRCSWARMEEMGVVQVFEGLEFSRHVRQTTVNGEPRWAFGDLRVTPTGHELELLAPPEAERFPDGVQCNHKGCLNHLAHPCEGCGRVGGQYRTPLEVHADRATGQDKSVRVEIEGEGKPE